MSKVIYWRRELPPLSEQVEGEHEVDAVSERIRYDYGSRQVMWGSCYPSLLAHAEQRIAQEVDRLGGSCAHVVEEAITAKIDDANAEFSLHGKFRFVMYRHPG